MSNSEARKSLEQMRHARSQSRLGSPFQDNRERLEKEPGNVGSKFWTDLGIERLPDNVLRSITTSPREPTPDVQGSLPITSTYHQRSLFGGESSTNASDATQIATHQRSLSEERQQGIKSSQLEDIVEELSLSPNGVVDEATEATKRQSTAAPTSQPRLTIPTNSALDPSLGTQVISPLHGYLGSAEDNTQAPTESLCSSSSESDAPPPPERQIPYSLRETARNGNYLVNTVCYDADDSGTFDPNAQRRRKQQPRRRATLHQVRGHDTDDDDQDDDDEPKQSRVFSLLNARQSGQCYIVTFDLNFERGKKFLSEHPDDNWPEKHRNTLNDEHIWEIICERQEEGGSSGPVLRPRKRPVRYNCPSEDESELSPVPDPKGEHEDLRGHPAARGCTRCRLNGHQCTLRKTGNTWPCVQCVEAFENEQFVDCELIIPPARKQACECCEKRKETCSFTLGGDWHDTPCEQCLGEGIKCIAGPAADAYLQRATYTPPRDVVYVPYRPYVACTACRQVKKSCSLKSKSDQPPCKACKDAKIPCTFEKVIPTNPGKRRIVEVVGDQVEDEEVQQQQPFGQNEEQVTSPRKRRSLVESPNANVPSSTGTTIPNRVNDRTNTRTTATNSVNKSLPSELSRVVLTDSDGHRGPLKVISTCMAHPVKFLQPQSPACNWCSNMMFGLFGLHLKQPTVIAWTDGLGYTELHDGHREAGLPVTIMCADCTMDRVAIASCAGHQMRALRSPFMSPETVGAELAAMLQRLWERKPLPTDRWCSICQSPAEVECCAEQDVDRWGGPVEPGSPEAVGCGLSLCETCEGRLGALGGDLQALVQEKLEGGAEASDARADAEFLLYDGLLMRNVIAQAHS